MVECLESPHDRRGREQAGTTIRIVARALAGLSLATGATLAAEDRAAADGVPTTAPIRAQDYVADGRLPLASISERFRTLARDHGWIEDSVYRYAQEPDLAITAWRTRATGPALWVLAGIHGEEPAGPNAIARNLDSLVRLARSGVPVVVIPLCNPRAYRQNWRYPNTAERDWRKGGYSVGDAEYLLPDLERGSGPRAPAPSGPETQALTRFVLNLAGQYPPRLVLDLHEDELSQEGGYIYSQGSRAGGNPVGAEIVRLLQETGIPLRRAGRTRFGEAIVGGVISRDDHGRPIRDGSTDELLAATEVFIDGKRERGPSARTVIVVETPAFEGSRFDLRVAAQGAVLRRVAELWKINETSE